jgi:hypothetical protein
MSEGTVRRQAKDRCLPLLEMASALVAEDNHTMVATRAAAVVTTPTTMAAHAHAHRREGSAAAGRGCRVAPARGRRGATMGMTGQGAVETEELTGSVRATSGAGAAGDSRIARGAVAGATGATDALSPFSATAFLSLFQQGHAAARISPPGALLSQTPTSSGFYQAAGRVPSCSVQSLIDTRNSPASGFIPQNLAQIVRDRQDPAPLPTLYPSSARSEDAEH